MHYQKELSVVDRKNPENNIPVYWCNKCDILWQYRSKIMSDSLTVVRKTKYKNKKKPIFG